MENKLSLSVPERRTAMKINQKSATIDCNIRIRFYRWIQDGVGVLIYEDGQTINGRLVTNDWSR